MTIRIEKDDMRSAIVIEKGSDNNGAYAPDVPGCVTTGRTVDETRQNMVEPLLFQLESLAEHGETIPKPGSFVHYVDTTFESPTLPRPICRSRCSNWSYSRAVREQSS